ncbi:unnamed protein product [Sympodiomycopsis kandeliae]
MNPATPATILALAATILLALATCTAPVTKSLYFLEILIQNRDLKLGALGYCLGSRCTSPSVGYKIEDAQQLLGVNTNIPHASQLSGGVVHALSYTLILHPVACGLAAVSLLFALINHCAGAGIGCVGGLFTGFAITVSLVAFALDLGLFTVLKKRVESQGGTATYGNGIWMTLAAFVCLILCQIAFCCCCCGSRGGSGGRRNKRSKKDQNDDFHTPHPDSSYGDRMRMDALQAEVNRNNRRQGGQGDLPKFAEYVTEHEVPLKHDYNDGAYDESRRYTNDTSMVSSSHHYPVGQAYGGGEGAGGAGVGAGANAYDQYNDPYAAGSSQYHPNQQYHQGESGFAPGVGPGYGAGAAAGAGGAAGYAAYHHHHNQQQQQQQDPYDHNNVGGFGAHGHPGPDAGGEAYGYPQEQNYDAHEYYDGNAAPVAAGGVVGRQPSTYRYGQDGYRSRHTSDASRNKYTPSVTSGYAQGNAPQIAMPEPMPALPSQYTNQRQEQGCAPEDDDFDQEEGPSTRRGATQDDGFGLSALQAGAAGSSSNQQHHPEASGMYYDAEEGNNQASSGQQNPIQEFGGQGSKGEQEEAWQHSTSARGHNDAQGSSSLGHHTSSAGGGEVPSYEFATGQAGHQNASEDPTSPSAMRAAGSYRPLPIPSSTNQWPNEKR